MLFQALESVCFRGLLCSIKKLVNKTVSFAYAILRKNTGKIGRKIQNGGSNEK